MMARGFSSPPLPTAGSLREGSERFKHWVAGVRGREPRWRRRAAASAEGTGEVEREVEPLKRLVALVRDTVQQILCCMDKFRSLQNSLASGIQDFLVMDAAGLDEPSLALVRLCLTLFHDSEPLLKAEGLRGVFAACEEVADDCEHVRLLLRRREEAYRELRHYEDKVAWLEQAALPQERNHLGGHANCDDEAVEQMLVQSGALRPGCRLLRNREKFGRARSAVEDNHREWEAELTEFRKRRTAHAKNMLLGLFREYLKQLADWGQEARVAAEDFNQELQSSFESDSVAFANEATDGDCVAGEGSPQGLTRLRRGWSAFSVSSRGQPENLSPVKMAEITLDPPLGPCTGDYEVEVCSSGFDTPISEVLVGGLPAHVVEASCRSARVRIPPSLTPGPLRVEVRAQRWQQRVATTETAFRCYAPVAFGACGKNIELSTGQEAEAGAKAVPAIATRVSGLLDGVVLTREPLASIQAPAQPQNELRYYFEVTVLEAAQRCTGTTRTVSLGFAWWLDGAAHARVPEMARQLPRSMVIGGDLPRAYVAGREHSKVSGWRPLFEVSAGTVLGALLQVQANKAKLTILQDGARRCHSEAEIPEDSSWGAAPHGVVDVCGTVQRVVLKQGAEVPKAALESGPSLQASPLASPRGTSVGPGARATRGTAQRRCRSAERPAAPLVAPPAAPTAAWT